MNTAGDRVQPGRASAPTTSPSFRVEIQGLRAVAVGLVLLYHAGVPIISGGYVGVDVFFVISGYLITSHLLRSLQRDGRIGFASFYARRARRILPASFAVLVLTVAAAFVWMPPLQLKALLQGAIATAVYLPNYYFAYIGTSYLSEKTPSLFQHYWSLGVEEQFYLVWPALLAIGFFAFRRSTTSLFVFVTVLTVGSLVFGILLTPVNQPWAFFSLPTRAWELGAGGLVAFALHSAARVQTKGPVDARRAWFEHRLLGVAGWAGLAGLVYCAVVFDDQTPFPSVNALVPVVSTALIIVGSLRPGASPRWLLSVRPLVFIGTISYSLYLVHWPVLLITQAAVGERDILPLWADVALMFACVPLAWVLYRFVETPLRNPPRLANARPRRSLLLAGAASVAVVAVCAVGIVAVGKLPLSHDRVAPAYAATVDPVGTDFVPSNLDPSLADAKDSLPATSGNGCHLDFDELDSAGCQYGPESAPTVTLFGDSHAEQWFPPLEKLSDEGRIRVDSNTKSSCNSANVTSLLNTQPYAECDEWRRNVIARLNADPPDVIVLANYARKNDVSTGGEDFSTYWQSALESTISELPKQSRVVIIGETATMGITAAICLSSHLSDADYCGQSPHDAIDQSSLDAETRAAAATGARMLDMNPYLCDARWCPTIIGNVLVYSDDHHLTVPFTTALSEVVWDALQQSLSETSTAPG